MEYSSLLRSVERGTKSVFDDLELTTENINNISTPAYKEKRKNSFGEIFTNMTKGSLNSTNNSRDLSIDGKGFFILENQDGEKYYSRNLTLTSDKDGYLKSGDKFVFPKQKQKRNYSDYSVNTDGKIYGLDTQRGEKILLGKLKLAHFAAEEELEFDGQFFKKTENSGEPTEIDISPVSLTKIRQKKQETSNVSIPITFAEFKKTTQQLAVLSQLYQALNTNNKQYIQSLVSAAGA